MTRSSWILAGTVVALVLLLAGSWWYFIQSNTAPITLYTTQLPPTQSTKKTVSVTQPVQTPTNTKAPSATINKSSLITNFGNSTITGTYANTGIAVVIAKGSVNMPSSRNDNAVSVVWSDRSDHGGGVDIRTDGTYSATTATALAAGTYTVGVYTSEGSLLTSGTLVVHLPGSDAGLSQ